MKPSFGYALILNALFIRKKGLAMKLVSFSVENFRSITNARKISLSNYSLLIGANNEGKSNILNALALAMSELESFRYNDLAIAATSGFRRGLISTRPAERQIRYEWLTDFPLSKQGGSRSNLETSIILEFELNNLEIAEFQREIRSSLNGTLPVSISFSRDARPKVSIKKQGKGKVVLDKKAAQIAHFVANKIRFEYIPAIRTADSANLVISYLLEKELRNLENDAEYKAAIEKIEDLQAPVLSNLSTSLKETVSQLMPSVKGVELRVRREDRFRSLRRNFEILIDDGQKTHLERKGEGVQSLVALGMMRHASKAQQPSVSTVIAIEEPESHLHPRAVRELREVIEALSEQNQVVLTSHSPIFVNPNNTKSTILVKDSKAVTGVSIAEIRRALGVEFSDNLQHARLMLLFEGSYDVKALRAILAARNTEIGSLLKRNVIGMDHLNGASALSQKAGFYKAGACAVLCFLDKDQAAETAVQKAIAARVLDERDFHLSSRPGLRESELEDLYNEAIYRDKFAEEFNVIFQKQTGTIAGEKWSSRMEALFKTQGKLWSDETKDRVKGWLAEYASAHPRDIIRPEFSLPIDSFIQTILSKAASMKL